MSWSKTSWPFGVGLDPLCTSVTVAPGKSKWSISSVKDLTYVPIFGVGVNDKLYPWSE